MNNVKELKVQEMQQIVGGYGAGPGAIVGGIIGGGSVIIDGL